MEQLVNSISVHSHQKIQQLFKLYKNSSDVHSVFLFHRSGNLIDHFSPSITENEYQAISTLTCSIYSMHEKLFDLFHDQSAEDIFLSTKKFQGYMTRLGRDYLLLSIFTQNTPQGIIRYCSELIREKIEEIFKQENKISSRT